MTGQQSRIAAPGEERGEHTMASLFSKAVQFANSPKGKQVLRQATDRAQQLAKDPKTKAKIDDVRRRIQGGGRGAGSGPAH
ncbi:hypothetical protein [Blastococcus sp. SYSU DS0973]